MSLSTQRNSLPALCFTWKQRLTEETWLEYYRDDFDDAALGAEWNTLGTGAGRAITEAGDVCTISITAGTNGNWFCLIDNNAPRMYFQLDSSLPARIETKINSHVVPTGYTFAGIMVSKEPNGQAINPAADQPAYMWGRFRDTVGGYNGVRVIAQCGVKNGIEGVPWDGTGPYWFRIEINVAKTLSFFSSTDGITWTDLGWTQAYVFDPLYVGLVVTNQFSGGAWPGRAAPFEYFLIERLGEIGEFSTIQDCVSFIDARAPSIFYSGRVKSMSSLRRAIDDKTGLYKIADMSVVLANNDRKYSRLATSGILKNQEATLVHIWTDQSEAAKLDVIDMVVEDQSLKGEDFRVKLKDITQKYFSKKIPGSICTEADYPNIHPDHIGRYMPEILGHNVIGTGYEKPGAVEAVYVNTAGAPYQYLASRGQLHSILNVYSEDALLGVGDWAFVAGPPSLINITPDQGDNRITFDANGYMTAGWNSANGYIQNLPYIIEYLLETLMEMPATKVDATAFDALATYFEDKGWDEDGFLILQKQQDAMEVLRQLLFTAGIKGYVALGGNFTAGIKDTFNYEIDSLDAHVFSQLELLNPPERLWNLPAAINTIKARYGYIPWQQLWFGGAVEEYKDNFYDAIMEDDVPIHQKDRPLPV